MHLIKMQTIIPKIQSTSFFMVLVFLAFGGIKSVLADNFERKWIFELNHVSPYDTVQAQPKEFLGKLYVIDGAGYLVSLEKETGKPIFRKFLGAYAGRRGFEINQETSEVVITADKKLFTLDTESGEILRSRNSILSFVAPIITDKCYIVLGTGGDIQCHDKYSDSIIWKTSLGITARIWSNAIFFQKTGLVYLVTSNPGGYVYENEKDRVDNFSSSLVAIQASDGSVVFSKRMIKNDVWDYDGVGRPILVENYLRDDGSISDLIIGTNKTGTIFAVNAENGKDVKGNQFRTEEFPVDTDGPLNYENTQIIPTWPSRIAEIKSDKSELRAEQIPKFKLRHAKFQEFLRPSVHYDVVVKGIHGGPEWHGGIYYEDKINNRKLLAYPSNNTTWIIRNHYFKEHTGIIKLYHKLATFGKSVQQSFYWTYQYVKEIFSEKEDEKFTVAENLKSQWGQEIWSNSGTGSKIRKVLHDYFEPDSLSESYENNCASCHGFDRSGKWQSEAVGDGYIPSLVGYTLTEKFSFAQNYQNLKEVHGNIPFPSEKEVGVIFSEFHTLDTKLSNENKLRKKGQWNILTGKDSLPLNKGPWGSVKIIDLNTGELKGSVPVGKSRDNMGNLIDSSIIFGGLGNPNSQGKTMLTGTVDPSAYYISLNDSKVESILNLKRVGSVNPYLTKINNCEAWIFVETGGRFSFYDRSNNGFAVEAFINKDNCD